MPCMTNCQIQSPKRRGRTTIPVCRTDEIQKTIRDSFIPAFTALKDKLVKKLEEAESNWIVC